MVQGAIILTLFLSFILGGIELGLLLFRYQTMERAVNSITRCKSIDEHGASCSDTNNYISSNVFSQTGISVSATTTCSSIGGGQIVEYTGTLNYTPFLVAPLRGPYNVTYCFSRQY